jgi:hypothetical protein
MRDRDYQDFEANSGLWVDVGLGGNEIFAACVIIGAFFAI